MTEKKEKNDEVKKMELPKTETEIKNETAMDKKVLDKKGRDWSKPRFFKKDGDV